jgi:putative solute:sodium symporter small subunit
VASNPDRSEGAKSNDAKLRRRRFPIIALLAWAVFAFAVPRLAQSLNAVDVLAVPLGFFMAAQGSLIAFLIVAVLSARRQDRLEGIRDEHR